MKNFEVYLRRNGNILDRYEINNLVELSHYLNDDVVIDYVKFRSKITGDILCWCLDEDSLNDNIKQAKNIFFVEACVLMRLGKRMLGQF